MTPFQRYSGISLLENFEPALSAQRWTCPRQQPYLALPGHADGSPVLVTGRPIDHLLSLPHVESVAYRTAIQLTLLTSLHCGKREKSPL